MTSAAANIQITYSPITLRGTLKLQDSNDTAIWERLTQRAIALESDYELGADTIEVPWATVLSIVREFAPMQQQHAFQFRPVGPAKERIDQFVKEYKAVRASRDSLKLEVTEPELDRRLAAVGFTKRLLKPFQRRDLIQLLSLSNGANFSVPGAGKTTVAFALHLLIKDKSQHLLVVAPKSAFLAWNDVVRDTVEKTAPNNNSEVFTVLSGGSDAIASALASGATRFLMTYDQLIRIPAVVADYLSRNPVHLVLDESHRMKAGLESQRGSVLLNLSSLPVRRDILSGTPMPQAPADLQSQLDFLGPAPVSD